MLFRRLGARSAILLALSVPVTSASAAPARTAPPALTVSGAVATGYDRAARVCSRNSPAVHLAPEVPG